MTRVDPGLPGATVRHSNELFVEDDGKIRVGTKITMSPEQFEVYRQGYKCMCCHSVQSEPFPEVCETVWRDTGERCGFPMRREQMRRLEYEFQGEETLWPDFEDDDERARYDLKSKGVWLPPGA